MGRVGQRKKGRDSGREEGVNESKREEGKKTKALFLLPPVSLYMKGQQAQANI